MRLDQLTAVIAEVEGPRAGPLGTLGTVHRFQPEAAFPGALRVRGRRSWSIEAEPSSPFPDAGALAQFHGQPRVGALAAWLDCRGGVLRSSWAASGEFPLGRSLGAGFGADLVQPEARPAGPHRHQACLIGHPRGETEGAPRAGIDHLISALLDADWTLLVWATPLSAAVVDAAQARQSGLLQRIRALPEGTRAHPAYAGAEQLLDRSLEHLSLRRAQGLWRVATVLLTDSADTLEAGMVALGSAFPSDPESPRPVRVLPCSPRGQGDPAGEWLGADQLAVLLAPPRMDWPGFRQEPEVAFDLDLRPARGRAWHAGDAMVRGAAVGPEVHLEVERLARHVLVCGIPGSGKSHTLLRMALRLWQEHRVPTLVIEPAKAEYRRLLNLLSPERDGLHVFTPGIEQANAGLPLRLNPFDPPPGTPPATWVDGLLALLQASFVLYPPMPYVLHAALQRVYQEAGWDLTAGDRGRTPDLDELVEACDAVVDELGYDGRIAADVKAALRARLDTLRAGPKGLLYGTGVGTPDAELFDQPCVIELDALPRPEDKAFAMGLLVLRLSCLARWSQGPSARLRRLLILEEAHHLLRSTGGGAAGGEAQGGDPRARGVEQLCDLVSEIRAYGVGVVVADQSPGRLAPDAVRNTDLKIVHRLVAEDDRALVGAAAAMSPEQQEQLLRLHPGEAVVFQEPMPRPVLLRVPLLDSYEGEVPTLEGVARRQRSCWPRLPKPFPTCARCPLAAQPCGPVLAAARARASDPDLLRRDRAAAMSAQAGLPGEGLGVGQTPAEQCERAVRSTAAARWLGRWSLQSATQTKLLAAAMAAGSPTAPIPPTRRGPLSACASCPAPCTWRRAGAAMAGDPRRWRVEISSPEHCRSPIGPTWELAAWWAGRPAPAATVDLVYCIAAHELDRGLLQSAAARVGGLLAAHLAPYRRT